MSPRRPSQVAAIAIALIAWSEQVAAATSWSVNYPERGTGRGFFDTTACSAVAGNNGKTLGEQRRIAFEAAVATWANVVSSSVPLTIEATMAQLACDADGAVLGQASAASAVALRSVSGGSLAYPVALANALGETDLETGSNENPSGAELVAEFNGAVGNADCLHGQAFYLGLDGKAGDDIDFLGVVLHELAHGLGFSSYLDFSTGEGLFPGVPDAFSTHTFDLSLGADWSTLKPAQLLKSIKNTRQIVWDGAYVKAAAPRYLVKGAPKLTVTPAVTGLSGQLSEHDDGPKPSEHPATGPLVVPNPASGCSRPTNASKLNGAIALVDPKSECHPLEAVGFMEVAGAKAVIAIDPKATRPPAMIVGILEGQSIPVVSIHRDDATILSSQAAGRTVTLEGDTTRLVGADGAGRVYLNATDPIVEESSISHWDPMARNQLLMEPERSAGHDDVDLTREFMRDLGWPICGDGAVQAAEQCDDGNNLNLDGCDANCKKGQVASAGAGPTGSGGSVTSTGAGGSANASTVTTTNTGAGGSSSASTTTNSNANAGADSTGSGTSPEATHGKDVSCSCRMPGSTGQSGLLFLGMVWLTALSLRRMARRS